MQRLTAIALVPLSVWFVISIVLLADSDHAAFVAWIRTPLVTISVVMMLVSMFYHMALGLQVVIEDYVRSAAKLWLVSTVRFCCFALAGVGTLATLRIAIGGA